jgi:hypothetical protein
MKRAILTKTEIDDEGASARNLFFYVIGKPWGNEDGQSI